ncbi:MAG: ROK family protein, partial [Magnetovibrio sp.]|nr:ROK family protein [Magnetovibrio sp.]
MRIGIDLGGTKIEGILIAADGQQAARTRFPTPQGDYAATVQAVADLVHDLDATANTLGCPIPSVGIGIPGTISPVTGLVKNANSVCLIGQALDQDIAALIKRDVRLANDANCFAVSESHDGAAMGAPVVSGVILGTGVGGGISIGGHPHTGPNAIAGEWGHNPLPWPSDDERPGLDCYCGQKGCIETFLSGPGLRTDHYAQTGDHMDTTEIVAQARRGDGPSEATLRRYEHRLARALASVINVLDPD